MDDSRRFMPARTWGLPLTLSRRVIGRRTADVVFIVVLSAGIAKATDLSAFEDSLAAWTLIPPEIIPFASLSTMTAEVAIGLGWFLRLAPRLCCNAGLFMLLVFTCAYGAQAYFASPPTCGCFSRLEAYVTRNDSAWAVIARNMALWCTLLAGVLLMGFSTPSTHAQSMGQARALRQGWTARGFTLLELLLVISLIGVLVSLMLPSVGRLRQQAFESKSSANLRQHVATFHAYSTDWADRYPFFTDPRATWTVIRCSSHPPYRLPYFGAHARWNCVLAGDYYQANCQSPTFYRPGGRWSGGPTSYHYGCSFIAHPRYWDPAFQRTLDLRVATSPADVIFPSKKGLLFGLDPLEGEHADPSIIRSHVGLVDGSATALPRNSLRRGVGDGDGLLIGWMHQIDFPWGLHTRSGVRGRDLE